MTLRTLQLALLVFILFLERTDEVTGAVVRVRERPLFGAFKLDFRLGRIFFDTCGVLRVGWHIHCARVRAGVRIGITVCAGVVVFAGQQQGSSWCETPSSVGIEDLSEWAVLVVLQIASKYVPNAPEVLGVVRYIGEPSGCCAGELSRETRALIGSASL